MIDAEVDAAQDIFCRLRPLCESTMWKGLTFEPRALDDDIVGRYHISEQPSAADYMEWMQRTQTMCWQECAPSCYRFVCMQSQHAAHRCRFKEQLLAAITWDNLPDIAKIRRLWALQPYFVSHGSMHPPSLLSLPCN